MSILDPKEDATAFAPLVTQLVDQLSTMLVRDVIPSLINELGSLTIKITIERKPGNGATK